MKMEVQRGSKTNLGVDGLERRGTMEAYIINMLSGAT